MALSPRLTFFAGFLAALVVAGAAGGGLLLTGLLDGREAKATGALDFKVPPSPYGAQKVVYHVASKGTWRDREGEAWRLISVINNHLNAVEPEPLSVALVFQGDGIDTLRRARDNPTLAAALGNLRKRGVAFRICANTLTARHVPLSALADVTEQDLVQAGVAELSHLQHQGFTYIRF